MNLAIGCDIGATSTRMALVDLDTGNLVERRQHPSCVGDYKAGLKALANDIIALRTKRDLPVGVAIASQLDPERRRALVAPNLQWFDVPLARDLEAAIGATVTLDNDVRGAAHGELRFGALRGVTGTAASVFWGSGIGGALIAGGVVHPGGLSIAGEIGHMTYKATGPKCPCGKRGCYEIFIGGHSLHRRVIAKKIAGGTRDLFARAKKGDKKAKAFVDEVLAIMGQHLGNIATLLDPDAIVVGGSVGLTTFPSLKAAMQPHLLTVRRGKIKLVRAALGDDSGVLGAAALAASAR
jgi:glucokinase